MNEELLLLLKLISDAGLLVLIWLVQLVIYPSFRYYSVSDLKRWHRLYTGRITFVVLPLMLSQLVLSCWIIIKSEWELIMTANALLVVLTWVTTFLIFVPLHQKIDTENQKLTTYIERLIKYNWVRTFMWSIIIILTLIKIL